MTTAVLIQLFKDTLRGDLLSDQDQELGSDATIVVMLNEAQRQIAEWSQFTANLSVTLGSSTYKVALDSLNAVNRVRIIHDFTNPTTKQNFRVKPLSDLQRKYPSWQTDTVTGYPQGCWQDGRYAVFYPIDSGTKTYYINCECDPKDLSSSTTSVEPELDKTLHRAVARYAAYIAASTNRYGNVQQAQLQAIRDDTIELCQQIIHKHAVQL